MIINLVSVLLPERLMLERAGEVLTFNGVAYDFGPLADGATLPRAAVDCEWLASDVERIDGVLHLAVVLPCDWTAPEHSRFPQPIIDPPDGPVALPIYDMPVSEAESDDD